MHPRDIFAPRPDPDKRPTDPEQIAQDAQDEIDAVLADPLIRWRAEQLAAMGFTPGQARTLALKRTVDLHWVRTALIERGCERDLAFDIAS